MRRLSSLSSKVLVNSLAVVTLWSPAMRSSSVASAATESTKVASLAWDSTGPVKTRRNLEGRLVEGKEKLSGDLKRAKTPEILWLFGMLLHVIARMLQASDPALGFSKSVHASLSRVFVLTMSVQLARSSRALERSTMAAAGTSPRKTPRTKLTASTGLAAATSSCTDAGVMSCCRVASAPMQTRGRCKLSDFATSSSSKPCCRRCVIRHRSEPMCSSTSMKKWGVVAAVGRRAAAAARKRLWVCC
mmetsp:Transcript_7760/g.21227  ORF Transcript_7760/g.21227 Transcript_7760/m.21227 type:complete len:246 (+) Transcript_7760:375-1112(+)